MNETENMSNEQRHAIYKNLAGTTCVCGSAKKARQSLCRAHYFRLPPGTRQALYETEGYPETFARACETLGLALPETGVAG